VIKSLVYARLNTICFLFEVQAGSGADIAIMA